MAMVPSDMSMQEESAAREGLLSVNDLNYSLKPDLSVCVSSTSVSNFFQAQTYGPGQTAVVILNTGSSFVYGPNSSLVVEVTVTGGDTIADFGDYGGSCANIINRITILTRSGSVLERVDNSNVLSSVKIMYEKDINWLNSTGLIMGAGATVTQVGKFVIPMSILSGLFASEYLLPSALMSGLRIELVLDTFVNAFHAATATNYSVTAIKLETEVYQLTDSVMRTLNERAATDGLECVFPTYFNTQSTRNTNAINLESRRSCSRALSAFYKEMLVRTTPATNHPMATAPYGNTACSALQWRCGSLYFPNSVISASTAVLNSAELYYQTLKGFKDYNNKYNSNINSSYTTWLAGGVIQGVNLERSTIVDLSGIPLSNSRVLSLNATFSNNNTVTGNLFLQYLTLARVFLSNVTVEV